MTSSTGKFDVGKEATPITPGNSASKKAAALLMTWTPILPRLALYSAALFGSFFLTLWLTEPSEPWVDRSDRAKLVTHKITSVEDFKRAAGNAGFRFSSNLRGSIDWIKRIDAGNVTMAGWLADKEGYADPIEIVVVTRDGKTASTRTAGERADVTRELSLGFGAEKNVSYQITFACGPGDQPFVIGIGTKGQYIPLISPRCP
jgi:hypothetical protein